MPLGWPDCATWYKLFTDWGSFIGGLLALAAGYIAYRGARKAAAEQVAATKAAAAEQVAAAEKQVAAAERQIEVMQAIDRRHARSIEVAVKTDMREWRDRLQSARHALEFIWPKLAKAKYSDQIPYIRQAKIGIPPMTFRSFDNLYLIDSAGSDLIQLMSLVLRYNADVDFFIQAESEKVGTFEPIITAKGMLAVLDLIDVAYEAIAEKLIPTEVAPVMPPPPSAP